MNTNENESLVKNIIGAAYEVSNVLGAGFLEKVYERALLRELAARGLAAKAQVTFPVEYKGGYVGDYIADLVVDDRMLVELKCVDSFVNLHVAKCINYLRASGLSLGLLINFQRPKLEWKRIVYSRPFAAKTFSA